MSSPFFSVILPLYNKQQSVTSTIESVLSQSFSEFELVVVDDGSTDGSLSRVQAFNDDRIRIVEQSNQGVSVARNVGVAEAGADTVAFIDADDRWHSEFLATIANLMNEYPESECYATAWQPWSRDDHVPSELPTTSIVAPKLIDYPRESREDVVVHICSLVVAKSVFLEIGGFPPGVRIYEDQDLCCRLADRAPFAFSPLPLVYYVRDAENRACERRQVQDMPPWFVSQEPLMASRHPIDSREWHLKEFLVTRYLQEVSLAAQTPGEGMRAARLVWRCRKTAASKVRWLKACVYLLLPAKVLSRLLDRVRQGSQSVSTLDSEQAR